MTIEDTFESILIDRKARIETFCNIPDKNSNIVPFILNPIQDRELQEQSQGHRDIYLKPAQVGSTSLWACDFLMNTLTTPNRTTIFLANEDLISQRLLLKAKVIYKYLETEDGKGHRIYWPALTRDSADEMFFGDLQSTIYTGSAMGKVFGRSEPIHNLLASEIAFYPHASQTITPALDRVPMDGGMVVFESTPNGEEGMGAYFCKSYRDAKDGNSVFKAHFYRWFDNPQYSIPWGSHMAIPEVNRYDLEYTDEELELIELHSLTEDQIRWRRRKMLEKLQAVQEDGDRLLFQQEFPEDDLNCFLVAGDQAYDMMRVEYLARNCFIPSAAHYPNEPDREISYDGFAIWFPPEVGHSYDVTIDPSLGTGRAGNSKTVIQVWEFYTDDSDKEHARHCATASGYFQAETAAAKAMAIADHYNRARIIVETNPPGIPVAVLIQRYPHLYIREDIISGRRRKEIGWLTTPRTKPFMISEMQRMLPVLETYDNNLVSQLRNMRYIGNLVVAVGPDDHHDAAAIAMATRRSANVGQSRFAGSTQGWPD